MQPLELVPCSVFFCRILEPFAERIQEVFPNYGAVVVLGVQSVEELAEVPNPAGYLFSFDIGKGIGSPSNVRLVRRYRPIEAEIQFEFVKKIVR